MASIKPQSYFQTIKQFRCTNCGGEISLINSRTRYIGCQYCGAVVDARSEAHQVITKLNQPSKYPPKSFIRLGMQAKFDGVRYQVLGRTCWRSVYKEYWKDEDGSGYSDETWKYDEWILMSEYQTFFYLIEDEEGYVISTSIVPVYPNLLSNLKIKDFYSNSIRQVQEYGNSEVVFFEGESTYQIHAGDKVQFTEYMAGKSFIVETRLDNTGTAKEIEFFEETKISRNQLLTAFGGNPEVDKLLQLRTQRRADNKFWLKTFGFAGIIFLLLLFYSLGSGNQIFTQKFVIPQALDSNKISETPELLTLIRPFEVQPGIVKLVLSASFPDNSDAWVGLELQDSKGEIANVLDDNFFQESGTEYWQEDGESGWEDWEESEREKEAYYRVEQTDTYSGKVYVIPNAKGDVTVQFTVFQGSILSRYFMIAAICCGVGFVIMVLAGIRDWNVM
ncbi:hypothetical protein QNI16_06445 [Cytophagaceae bacterium YF14B1]|uniref:DUF4178 domain-containing protein n=1 Tax=Xanthocytophaga flava TaxID=3048013 RepID=A0AAE3U4W6_9BACT|nr:hypothetical protein [Xanthocytophaga flavus]MDJ1480119.1 hypothetical protein [Xanthocytophaga flavus]